ncbi:hypothetical protein TNCV_4008901 [Trichonephila clavipes]|nr:hypothetical protein TNCV_4008901 [Trichonephila clavipes]
MERIIVFTSDSVKQSAQSIPLKSCRRKKDLEEMGKVSSDCTQSLSIRPTVKGERRFRENKEKNPDVWKERKKTRAGE